MIVQSRSLCRSSCSPALLSLMTEPIATPVRSRGPAPRRSRWTKKGELHGLSPDRNVLKLKLQVVSLNELKRQLIPTTKPARWLNNHEWSAWLHLLATFTLLPAAIDSQLQREAGMSHFEFGVMAALSRQPGRRLQLKDLAVVANGSLSRLSHVISRLGRQGLGRRVSGTKGRATNAELTDKGYRKLMEAGPGYLSEGLPAPIQRPETGG